MEQNPNNSTENTEVMLILEQKGGKIKMVAQESVELVSPQEHIKNVPTCGTIPTENKLETGRKGLCNQGCKERSIGSQVGREKQQAGRILHP